MNSIHKTPAPHALRRPVTAPAAAISGLRVAGRAVLRFLEAFSQRKAAAEILELARVLQSTRPEMAAQMRRAASKSWD